MAAELTHDVEALPNAGSEVTRSGDEIALIDVVRTHAAEEKFLNVRFHDLGSVIDMAQEDGLIAEWDAGVGEASEGVANLEGQFTWVIGVDADEEGVELFEHGAQFRGDALGEEDGDAGADPDELEVGDGAELAEQMFEFVVVEQERVATAEQDVADLGSAADVIDLAVKLGVEIVSGGIADEARACAIAAVGGAAIGSAFMGGRPGSERVIPDRSRRLR
jgi:hypothetical protein